MGHYTCRSNVLSVPMNIFFALLILFFFGQGLWRAILKEGAYPSAVKPHLKWFHAAIILYLEIYILCALSELFWLIHYRSELIASFHSNSTIIAGPIAGMVRIMICVSGFTLIEICSEMSKRRRKALKWYFIVWPINFLCELYIVVPPLSGKFPASSVTIVTVVLCALFFASILFYLNASIVNALFEIGQKRQVNTE